MHHLRRHDYSQWARESITDEELDSDLWQIENDPQLTPQESRNRVFGAVQTH